MPKRKKRTRAAITRATAAKRERFAQEYVVDLNSKQAAIRAGYAPNSAHVTGSRLLSDAKVGARVEELKAILAKKYEVTQERTLKQIARIAYGDPRILYDSNGNMKPVHELSDDAAALLAGIETEELYEGTGKNRVYIGQLKKAKVRSSERALSMAMNYLGMGKTAGQAGEGLVLSIRCSDGKGVR